LETGWYRPHMRIPVAKQGFFIWKGNRMNETIPQFTIEEMTADTVEPAMYVRAQSWLDTYTNEDLGVTREWIEARNADQLSPEKIAIWKQRLSEYPGGGRWVAKDTDGIVIGIVTPRRDDDGVQHVGSLYVAKVWQGKGVGGALIQKVIEWSDPTSPIELGVAVYNGRAKAFYRKWGFEEIPGSETLFDNMIPEVKMIRKGDKQ
jgi:GNAT superfamily N-acetyltransferase